MPVSIREYVAVQLVWDLGRLIEKGDCRKGGEGEGRLIADSWCRMSDGGNI